VINYLAARSAASESSLEDACGPTQTGREVLKMCQPRSERMHSRFGACSCGCSGCGCGPSFRRFFSTKEEEEWLENYRDQLKKELAGLEERLNECKGK